MIKSVLLLLKFFGEGEQVVLYLTNQKGLESVFITVVLKLIGEQIRMQIRD